MINDPGSPQPICCCNPQLGKSPKPLTLPSPRERGEGGNASKRRVPIPMKAPVFNGMIPPGDSG